MKNFVKRYFLDSSRFLGSLFFIIMYIAAFAIAVKWWKTLGIWGAIVYLIIVLLGLWEVYKKVRPKESKKLYKKFTIF